ncbi:MAG TPA: DUF4256 domain-containing protein, partial [Chryseolinea sp.]
MKQNGVVTRTPEQREELLRALKARFAENMNRHKGLEWSKVKAKLKASTEKLWSLNKMERTGGEPDVVGHDKKTDEYIFCDCSAESPTPFMQSCLRDITLVANGRRVQEAKLLQVKLGYSSGQLEFQTPLDFPSRNFVLHSLQKHGHRAFNFLPEFNIPSHCGDVGLVVRTVRQ